MDDHRSTGDYPQNSNPMSNDHASKDTTLPHTEELSREVFEQSPLGITLIGLDLRIMRANPAYCRMLEYSEEELTQLTLADVTHPDDFNLNLQQLQRVLTGEIEAYGMEKRYITKGRRTIWGNLRASFIRDAEGKILYGLGLVENITEKKKTEAALKETEDMYRSLTEDVLDSSAVGTLILDPQTRVVWANRAYVSFFGLVRENIVGRRNQQILRDEIVPLIEEPERFERKLLATYPNSRAVTSFDFKIATVAGRQDQWLEHRSGPIRSGPYAGGRIEHYDDISERKRTETALRESEERLRNLIENVSDFILTLDLDGRITFLNRANPGTDVGSLVGARLSDFLHVEEQGSFQEVFDHIVQTGEPNQYEGCVIGRDGRLDWYSCRMNPILRDGRVVAVTLIASNFTERKTNEDKIRDNEERLKILFEKAPDAYYISDMTGTFLDGNQSAVELTGYEKAELLGKSFLKLSLLPPAQIPRAAMLLARNAMGHSTGPDTFTLIRKDGSPARVEIRTFPTRIKNQRVVLGIARDIMMREGSEMDKEGAYQTEKWESLEHMAGGFARELNQLLTDGFDEQSQVESAQLERAVQPSAEIARRLRWFSGNAKPDLSRRSLSEIARDLLIFPYVPRPERVVLESSIEDQLPAVQIDAPQVRRALMELLRNACDAMEEGGVLRVRTGLLEMEQVRELRDYIGGKLQETSFVFIEIEDDGIGVDEATRKRMCDPFFSTKPSGRGLGLTSVLGVLRVHMGALLIDSARGKGTKVQALFPAAPGKTRFIDEASDTDWRGRGTILVAHDELPIRSAAKAILESSGFDVLTQESTTACVEVFRTSGKDARAILLQATIPSLLVENAFAEIERLRPDTPILVMSETAEEEDGLKNQSLLAGFLRTPFGSTELVAKLREILGAG